MTAPKPSAKITTISPKKAAELLARNTRNRRLVEFRVNKLVADMLAGSFVFNGDAIRIAVDGTILDGQHRLHASVASGVTFQTILVEGLPPEVQRTIDTGATRSMADVLHLERGTTNSTTVAALTSFSWLFQMNGGLFNGQYLAEKRAPSRSELLAWYDEHEETITHAVIAAQRVQSSPARLTTTAVAATFFGAALLDPEILEQFADEIATGSSDLSSPTRQLREYGIRRTQTPNKPTAQSVHMVTVRAWNKWVAGETVARLVPKYRPNDTTRLEVKDSGNVAIFPIPKEEP